MKNIKKMTDTNLVRFVEDGTKLKMLSDIQPFLTTYSEIYMQRQNDSDIIGVWVVKCRIY